MVQMLILSMLILKFLDIGDPRKDKKGFSGADDIAEWFRNDKSDDWRQRD